MRKSPLCLSVLLLTFLAGCVTINVYFPKAAAEKAADQFIGSVIGNDQQSEPADKSTKPASSDDDKSSSDDSHGQPLAARALNFLIPAAHAAGSTPNLRIHTPEVDAIHARMRQRYQQTMQKLLNEGLVGFTRDGLVAVRDPSAIPLARRATINSAVADDNRDRKALYQAIAEANGHPEWEARIRNIFAEIWISKAHAGWYVQTAGGAWKQK
ncbi:MAG TPA: YdbL family protein [Rhodanobacteraceae bacterium]|nr:YdbL family protein [Rhodanobacteraceae bacterium]